MTGAEGGERHTIDLETMLCEVSGCSHSVRQQPDAACCGSDGEGHTHATECGTHLHGPGCGHERVPHDSHFDYLVGSQLHHPHGTHCDHHGEIELVTLEDPAMAAAIGDHADNSSITRSVYAGLAHMQVRRNLVNRSVEAPTAAAVATPWYKDRDSLRFAGMFFLTGGFFFVELVYGTIIGSLALQADAFHMASDLIALVRWAACLLTRGCAWLCPTVWETPLTRRCDGCCHGRHVE